MTKSKPFTQNILLSLLKYLRFADIGWEFDPATQGIEYKGEIGMYYSKAVVAGVYQAYLVIFTWVTNIYIEAELVSPHHLRTVLKVGDGDIIEFTLAPEAWTEKG